MEHLRIRRNHVNIPTDPVAAKARLVWVCLHAPGRYRVRMIFRDRQIHPTASYLNVAVALPFL